MVEILTVVRIICRDISEQAGESESGGNQSMSLEFRLVPMISHHSSIQSTAVFHRFII